MLFIPLDVILLLLFYDRSPFQQLYRIGLFFVFILFVLFDSFGLLNFFHLVLYLRLIVIRQD